jgi:AcrR family transcriptional regulator
MNVQLFPAKELMATTPAKVSRKTPARRSAAWKAKHPARRRTRPVGRPPLSAGADAPDRRAQIIDAAAEVIGRQGYAHTSLKDIAIAAGVTPALIYHYFDSKEDLLLALMGVLQDKLHRAVDAARDRASEPFERIAATVDEAATQFTLYPEFFSLIYDMYMVGHSKPSIRAKGREMLENGIERQVDQIRAYYAELGNAEPPVPTEDIAAAIIAAVDGIAVSATVRGVNPAGMYRGLKLILLFAAALPYTLTTGGPPPMDRLIELVQATPSTARKEE